MFKRILEKFIILGGLYNYWIFIAITENLITLGVAGSFDIDAIGKGSEYI